MTGKIKKIILAGLLVLGVGLFVYFLLNFGKVSIQLINQNFNFQYLLLYIFFTLFAFCPITWRLQVILKAYGKNIPFWILLKQTIATYALSYITPTVRVGGEPLRAYMLQKEGDVDLKTGSSGIILDKFVEFTGSAVLGIIGLVAILVVPDIPPVLKTTFIAVLVIALWVILGFYIRTINSKGSLSTMFELARLHKIKNWHSFPQVIRDVEKMMEDFLKYHRKALFLSFLFYGMTGVIFFLEIKFLLLSIGVSTTLIDLILIINIWGIVNFLPVPAGIGFLEAGQSSLLEVLKGEGGVGFAMALLIRARSLLVVAIGFLLITQFSSKEIMKEFRQKNKKEQTPAT